MENKTARLTVLIDPTRKDAFEKLCHSQDMTPSQVMRRLIRDYMELHAGPPGAGAGRKQPRPRGDRDGAARPPQRGRRDNGG